MKVKDAEKVYAITSREHFPARYKNITEQLKSCGFDEYEEIFVKEKSPSSLPDGGWGCKMSHVKALKLAKEAGANLAVVFEDDIEIVNKNIRELPLPREFDIFYLSGTSIGDRLPTEEEGFVRLTSCATTAAVVYNISSADKLIQAIETNPDYPVDSNIGVAVNNGDLLIKKRAEIKCGEWEAHQRTDLFESTNVNI